MLQEMVKKSFQKTMMKSIKIILGVMQKRRGGGYMIIGIVDDDINDQFYLKKIIQDWILQEKIDIDIQCFQTGEAFLESYKKYQFTLVFMDIYMDEMSGIDVVKEIRKKDNDLLFVFLTTSKEHIFEATPLHIFDYIQKPYTQDRVIYVLNEMKKCKPYLNRYIEFDCGKQHVFLRLSDIMYLYANNNLTVFKTRQNEEHYRVPFSKVIEMIDDDRFLFCIRGIMVNMDYILKQEEDYFLMNDLKKVYIRRNEKKEIIKEYEDYQFKKLDSL